MSSVQPSQPEPGGRRGGRPKWPQPEESCGELVTKLPRGKQLWMITGKAAEVWTTLSNDIAKIVEGRQWVHVDISFHMFMIGRTKATASPNIIFCSENAAARKNLRKVVRSSGVLDDYPSIGLADASTPLAIGGSTVGRQVHGNTGEDNFISGTQDTQAGTNDLDDFSQDNVLVRPPSVAGSSEGQGSRPPALLGGPSGLCYRPKQGLESSYISLTSTETSTTLETRCQSCHRCPPGATPTGATCFFDSGSDGAQTPTPQPTSLVPSLADLGAWQPAYPGAGEPSNASHRLTDAPEPCYAPSTCSQVSSRGGDRDSCFSQSTSSLNTSLHDSLELGYMYEEVDGGYNTPTPKYDQNERTESYSSEEDSSSESEDPEEYSTSLDVDDPVRQQCHQIVCKVIQAFEAYRQLSQEPRDQESPRAPCAVSHAATRPETTANRAGKRAATRIEDAETSDEDQSTPKRGAKKRKTAGKGEKLFACPFWKKSRWYHPACVRYHLQRVKDVKQHLERCHMRAIRCARCRQVFDAEDLRDEHLRVVDQCPVIEVIEGEDEGITADQRRSLTQRGPRGASVEDQWFRMWDIVFPGLPRPRSVYLPSGPAEQVCDELREFHRRYGVDIILAHFQDRGYDLLATAEGHLISEDQTQHVLNSALGEILNRYMEEQEEGSREPRQQQIVGGGGEEVRINYETPPSGGVGTPSDPPFQIQEGGNDGRQVEGNNEVDITETIENLGPEWGLELIDVNFPSGNTYGGNGT